MLRGGAERPLPALKGVLRSHKSVTDILPNNPTMLPQFSGFMNFHPKLSDSCSGLIIRLEKSHCCNQTPLHTTSTLCCVQKMQILMPECITPEK